MASRRERIMQAVVARLSSTKAPARVHRNRVRPIEQDELPALVVYPAPGGEAVAIADHDDAVERRLRIRIEARELAKLDQAPDAAVDALLTWCTRRLLAEETLGGLAVSIEEKAVLWDAAVAQQGVFGAAGLDFEIVYHTDRTDPETLDGEA